MIHAFILLGTLSAMAEPSVEPMAEPAAEPTTGPTVEPRPQPNDAQRAMYDLLKVREAPPTCGALAALSEAPADDLIWLMDHANQPAWVGVRAAHCVLTQHMEEKATVIDTWVTDPDRRGLAILTIGMLDKVSPEHGERIAKKALAGPHAADARKRLIEDANPDLLKLVK